ncbi:hypothetical protein F2Q69_00003678 [Brassica cretica]|uniref:C3H1-type domain-containing protein n=1 Tax=Brassica cretica TaxID=69181 RepID=A0A8S9NVI8_BRACR|nr:hypothetical protein F2Q69_00003678 [Brassica cretica]
MATTGLAIRRWTIRMLRNVWVMVLLDPKYKGKIQGSDDSNAERRQRMLGQPACGNFKAYGFCKYGASCKFDHPVPVNPYHYAGLTMPTPYRSGFGSVLVLLLLHFLVQVPFLVFQFQSVVVRPPTALLPWHVAGITSRLSRSDSTTVSNGQTSENEKQDDGPDKTEVQDPSKLISHSDSTALSNDGENTSSGAKKGGDDPSAADNSREKDSSDNAT